jgi:hypothetical protein
LSKNKLFMISGGDTYKIYVDRRIGSTQT